MADNALVNLHADQAGSGILEKVAIIAAIAVPLFVVLYTIADRILGWANESAGEQNFQRRLGR